MYKFKDLARRGLYVAATVGMLFGLDASLLPTSVLADALNPLTERTLLLSSSAPGFVNTDGSGNSTYAPPGSGPNGQKTGETFTFKTSTAEASGDASTHIQAFTFQYCTTAAGDCIAPGDDTGDPGGSDDSSHSDLNVVTSSPSEVSSIPTSSSTPPGGVDPTSTGNNYAVEYSTDGGTTWTLAPGWNMDSSTDNSAVVTNLETGGSDPTTGKNNFITLTSPTHYMGWDGTTQNNLAAATEIKVQFFATNTNYITNPGSDAYFVKINDYNSSQYQNFDDSSDGGPYLPVDGSTDYTCGSKDMGVKGESEDCPADVIDGGVTVANIMNNSIQIRTKVLETLDFSVGTHDPDVDSGSHTPCAYVNNGTPGQSGGILNLGDPTAENSLKTSRAYDAFSYWRLSSNSSNGATVYYSGTTLSDTENDQIGQIYDTVSGSNAPGDNSADFTRPGSEQFGLGLVVNYQTNIDQQGDNGYTDDYSATDNLDGGGGTNAGLPSGGIDSGFSGDVTSNNPDGNYYNSWHLPQLFPLAPMGVTTAQQGGGSADNSHGTLGYGLAEGPVNAAGAGDAQFAFSKTANTIPVPIASESNLVVNCSTGLMRYIANIAATTPAGIYTTAINYLAAPEY